MNQVFRLILFLLVVFIFIFLVSLLLPAKVTITKSILINAPSGKVQNQLIHFDQWKNWYPAFKDENITIIEDPLKANSVILKNRKGQSTGLIIIQSTPSVVRVGVHSPTASKVNYEFILIPKPGNRTQVTWNVNTYLGSYPWNRIRGILLDKVSGRQHELALEDLKKATEE